MSELLNVARFTVHTGKEDEAADLVRQFVEIVREKDTRTLRYDVFFHSERGEYVFHERYEDSDAVLEHVGNLGDTFGAMLEVSDLTVEIYGAPSPALLAATEGLDITVYVHAHSL